MVLNKTPILYLVPNSKWIYKKESYWHIVQLTESHSHGRTQILSQHIVKWYALTIWHMVSWAYLTLYIRKVSLSCRTHQIANSTKLPSRGHNESLDSLSFHAIFADHPPPNQFATCQTVESNQKVHWLRQRRCRWTSLDGFNLQHKEHTYLWWDLDCRQMGFDSCPLPDKILSPNKT